MFFNSLRNIPIKYKVRVGNELRFETRCLNGDKDWGDFNLQSHRNCRLVYAVATKERGILKYLIKKGRFPFYKKNRDGKFQIKGNMEIKSLIN